MNFTQIYPILTVVLIIVGVFVVAVVYGRNKLSEETIRLLTQNKEAQDASILRLELDSKEKDKQIAHLTGQVDLLKDIPLQKISESLDTITRSHALLSDYMQKHDGQVEKYSKEIIKHIDANTIKVGA